MFSFKSCLIVGLSVLSMTLAGLYFKKGGVDEGRWIEVVFEPSRHNASNLDRDYSEYWDERPNGIGALKMNLKLIPNIDSSKNSFLIAYKAEVALNSQACKMTEEKRYSDNIFDFCTGPYEVEFWFSLLDEDGFRLGLIYTKSDETNFLYTSNFFDLMPDSNHQVEQAIITSNEISSILSKRIKKVSVDPRLKRYKEYNNKTIKE